MAEALQFTGEVVGIEASIDRAVRRSNRKPFKIQLDDRLSTPLGRVTGQTDKFDKAIAAATDRVVAFGAAATAFYTVQRSVIALVKSTVDVESSLARININLGESQSGLRKFGQELFQIARNTGQTFDEAAKGAEELTRQGLGATETLKRLNDALILSRQTGLSAADSVEAITASINSFTKEALDSTAVINKLAAVDQRFAVSSKDLAEGIARAGSTAADAGVSFDELLGLITSVQQTTQRGGAVIGNSFKTFFAKLRDKSVLDNLEAIGIGVRNIAGEALPATQVLQNLGRAYEGLSDSQKKIVNDNVGTLFQINALKAALSDVGDEFGVTARATEIANRATNQAVIKNEQLNQTLKASFNSLQQSTTQVLANLGNINVGPLLDGIIKSVDAVAQSLGNSSAGAGAGKSIGESLLQGISNVLTGPGVVLLLQLFAKTAIQIGKTVTAEFSSILKVNGAKDQRLVIEDRINQALSLATKLEQEQFRAAESTAEQYTVILGIVERINVEMARAAARSAALVDLTILQGGFSPTSGKTPVRRAAGGILPAISSEASAISRGVGGAPSSARPVVIPSFAMGGGKSGPVVANSSEYLVRNYAGGGDAIFNQHMAKTMGLPGGAKHLAGGFVPNGGFRPLTGKDLPFTSKKTIGSINDLLRNAVLASSQSQFDSATSQLTDFGLGKGGLGKAAQEKVLKETAQLSVQRLQNQRRLATVEKKEMKSADLKVRLIESAKQTAKNKQAEDARNLVLQKKLRQEAEARAKEEALRIQSTAKTAQKAAEEFAASEQRDAENLARKNAERKAKLAEESGRKEVELAKQAQRNAAEFAKTDNSLNQAQLLSLRGGKVNLPGSTVSPNLGTTVGNTTAGTSATADSFLGGRTAKEIEDAALINRDGKQFLRFSTKGKGTPSSLPKKVGAGGGFLKGFGSDKALLLGILSSFTAGFVPQGKGGTFKGIAGGAVSGALEGAGTGAALGSLIPGGSGIGLLGGAAIGGIAGGFNKASKSLEEFNTEIEAANAAQVKSVDAVERFIAISNQLDELGGNAKPEARKRLIAEQAKAIAAVTDPAAKARLAGGNLSEKDLQQVLNQVADGAAKTAARGVVGSGSFQASQKGLFERLGDFLDKGGPLAQALQLNPFTGISTLSRLAVDPFKGVNAANGIAGGLGDLLNKDNIGQFTDKKTQTFLNRLQSGGQKFDNDAQRLHDLYKTLGIDIAVTDNNFVSLVDGLKKSINAVQIRTKVEEELTKKDRDKARTIGFKGAFRNAALFGEDSFAQLGAQQGFIREGGLNGNPNAKDLKRSSFLGFVNEFSSQVGDDNFKSLLENDQGTKKLIENQQALDELTKAYASGAKFLQSLFPGGTFFNDSGQPIRSAVNSGFTKLTGSQDPLLANIGGLVGAFFNRQNAAKPDDFGAGSSALIHPGREPGTSGYTAYSGGAPSLSPDSRLSVNPYGVSNDYEQRAVAQASAQSYINAHRFTGGRAGAVTETHPANAPIGNNTDYADLKDVPSDTYDLFKTPLKIEQAIEVTVKGLGTDAELTDRVRLMLTRLVNEDYARAIEKSVKRVTDEIAGVKGKPNPPSPTSIPGAFGLPAQQQ